MDGFYAQLIGVNELMTLSFSFIYIVVSYIIIQYCIILHTSKLHLVYKRVSLKLRKIL